MVIAPKVETSAAYRAGLFDGEGSVTGMMTKQGFVPVLSMGNTDLSLLGAMQTAYTGHIVKCGLKPGRKQSWTWTARSAPKVRAALVDMLPYLIGKQERARLMLVLLTTYPSRRGNNRNLTPQNAALRAQCITELRKLNQRGAL